MSHTRLGWRKGKGRPSPLVWRELLRVSGNTSTYVLLAQGWSRDFLGCRGGWESLLFILGTMQHPRNRDSASGEERMDVACAMMPNRRHSIYFLPKYFLKVKFIKTGRMYSVEVIRT